MKKEILRKILFTSTSRLGLYCVVLACSSCAYMSSLCLQIIEKMVEMAKAKNAVLLVQSGGKFSANASIS